jgi:hypothetical protein
MGKPLTNQQIADATFGDDGRVRSYNAAPGSSIFTKYDHFYEWWAHTCYGVLTQKKGQEGWHVSLTVSPAGRISEKSREFSKEHLFDSKEKALAWINTATSPKE